MKNCGDNNLKMFNKLSFSASKIYHEIEKLEDPKLKIKQQVIDTRNKCKFLITNEGYLIPTRPSGTIWNVSIIKNIDKYIVKVFCFGFLGHLCLQQYASIVQPFLKYNSTFF